MKKGQLSHALRQLGLIYTTDWVRFYIEKLKNAKINKSFRDRYPEVKLPPDYLMYESFQLNYEKYYVGSKDTAKWLADYFRQYIDLKDRRILDWGCGPGRIIRHLPEEIGNGCQFYGTDYNKQSIDWCSRNLTGIQFNQNTLDAKLPYENNYFDIIYGISIFTHLSEPMHHAWYQELSRILKPGGILFLTTQGNNFLEKLTPDEVRQYDKQELVVRGKVKEGHRTYSAFHPQGFMAKLFSDATVLAHIQPPIEPGKGVPQDIWIVRKAG